MFIAVIGSRTFSDYAALKKKLSLIITNNDTIVSGGASGADKLAEKYAQEYNVKIMVLKPDWYTHGKKAGILRNTDIVNHVDMVVAFWDGYSTGTRDTLDKALKANKSIQIHYF